MTSSPALTAIDFEREIQQLTDNFTGRDWIFDKIYQWLKYESDRFFLLTGRPGTGKSAIAAQLTKISNDIKAYHFCRAGDVETVRPGRIFRSIAAQLGKNLPLYGQALANTIKPIHLQVEVNVQIESMTGSQLTGVYIENLKESDPDNELDILIRAPFAELEKMYADKQQKSPNAAVILIDSLDEAVTTTGNENLVRLLAKLSNSDLPGWVRFIMTSRPEDRVTREFKPLDPYKLEKYSEESKTDICQYIEKRVRETNFQAVLQEAKVAIDSLSARIAELSKGIFLYAELLLNDIEAERQPINDLSALPKDIDDIYHNFLKRFTTDQWQNNYQRILGRLTVTQEPLTEEQLVNFTGINSEQLRYNLGVVKQFLDEDVEEGEKTYAIFHQSFRDYLLDKKRNNDFWCDAQRQHNLIVDYYKKGSQVWEEVDWTKADKYGLLHLPKHLDGAGRKEDFYTLLTGSPKWMNSKFKVFSSDAPYVNDLELAINKFSDPLESNQLLTLIKLYTARQVVHQRSSNYEDIDLKTLVLLGRETEALAYARLRKNVNRKFTSLMTICNALQEKSQFSSTVLDVKNIFNEAKEVAKLIQKNSLEADTILDFATALLKASNFTEVEKLADEIEDTLLKVIVLQQLAVDLDKVGNSNKAITVFKEVKKLIDTIEEDWAKAQALRELAAALSKVGNTQEASTFFSKAREVTNVITDNWMKTDELIDLALALAEAKEVNEASLILNEAEKIAHVMETWKQIKVLPQLAIALSQVGFAKQAKAVFIEVKNLILQTERNWGLADELTKLATALVQVKEVTEATKIFRQAIEVENGFEEGLQRAKKLRQFTKTLFRAEFTEEAREFFADARKSASSIQENSQQKQQLLDLAAVLARARWIEEARKVFAEAEELPSTNKKESRREKVLSKWAAVLNLAGFSQEARTICDNKQKIDQAAQEIDRKWEQADDLRKSQNVAGSFDLGDAIEEISQQEQTQTQKEALRLLKKDLEQDANLVDLEREAVTSILATCFVQIKSFTEALSTLGLQERPHQFLDNLAVWTPAFKEFDEKLLVNILQETTRIFGWTYPDWDNIYENFTSSRNYFSLLPEEVQRLEAYIQESITIISSKIPKNKQSEERVRAYIIDIVNAKLNIV